MDLDKALVAALVREGKGSIKKLFDKGFNPEYLDGEGKKALDFVLHYNSLYGDLPKIEVVEGKLGIPDLGFSDAGSPVEFLVGEVIDRKLSRVLKTGLEPAVNALAEGSTKKSIESLEELMMVVRQQKIAGDARVRSMFSLADDLKDYYDKMEKGMRGILTPWPSINDVTLGFWPEDLILFVARSGVGKTWASLMVTLKAWQQDKKVLYVTTEMSQMRIYLRFAAIMQKLPYNQVRSGKLSPWAKENFFKTLDELKHKSGLDIIGGNFDFRIESLAAAVDEAKPDMVVLDGIYLLKVPGQNRTEQAANAFNEMKRLCKSKQIPVVVTSQFNREVKVNQANSVKAESIALTDTSVWNSDLIFGMIQTDDYKRDKRMVMKPLKFRDGVGEDVEMNWDFDTMNFDELPKGSNGAAGEADDFSTGFTPSDTGGGSGGAGGEVPF